MRVASIYIYITFSPSKNKAKSLTVSLLQRGSFLFNYVITEETCQKKDKNLTYSEDEIPLITYSIDVLRVTKFLCINKNLSALCDIFMC